MNTTLFADLDPDVYRTAVVIFVLLLLMRFILVIIKNLLDHKLKNRIIEKGLSQDFTASLLQTQKSNEANNNIKWFLLLLSTGIGLLVVGAFPPLGFHSMAIVAIIISLGFLGNSYFLRTSEKQR